MGVPGALRQIIDNGEKLIKSGVAVGVLMNALEFNLDELHDAQIFFESKGFKFSVGYENRRLIRRVTTCGPPCSRISSSAFWKPPRATRC